LEWSGVSGFEASWLALREPYDHLARSAGFADRFTAAVGASPYLIDLGCGTGSNLRYLVPRIAGPQRWLCVDHNPRLLNAARVTLRTWADGRGWPCSDASQDLVLARPDGEIAIVFACDDLARGGLPEGDGFGALTASALLDLTSAAWLEAFATRCSRMPLLLGMSFDGRLTFEPAVPADDEMRERFSAHQRLDKGFGPALGPDAASHLAEVLAARGCDVTLEPADWHLGPDDRPLLEATFEGIVRAACEIANDASLERWVGLRRRQLAAGDLGLTVGHLDLLALPA
jgi:SAM-dependent methyltransferase